MLQQFLIPKLEEDDKEGPIHFQQDSAPPQYFGEVREYPNTRFPGRWIDRAALIAWPLSDLSAFYPTDQKSLKPWTPKEQRKNFSDYQTRLVAVVLVDATEFEQDTKPILGLANE
jgi:hypothetical protein